ncbi:MAG: metallophosphoesterase [Oscillospiraceae bacterium]|nr:metallophosphoesterase [Oscillospiraceae bacterium]
MMRTKDKFKNTFSIIHLSDLHIVSHSEDYSISLHKMIDHINEVTKNIEKIIIVFTGDLVEKGNFGESEDVIIHFFEDLYKKIGKKTIDIIFVPGNHDKKRGALLLKNLEYENDEKFWEGFKKNDWKYFENQFNDFLRIVNKIRNEIFQFEDTLEGTYGVQITQIDQYKICFLRMNSAWLCMDNNDEGRLRIGRFQLDDLKKQYQNQRYSINLVIALMHHPTDWLTKNEQKYLNQYMTDEYRLNTNIMLQGHIHEKETYNWYNQNHSLTTLVTGMGWDQQKDIKDNGHRYSLYEINIDSSIIRVNTFVSDADGKFNEDTEVYKENNIIFPLFVHKYLEINKLKFNESEYPLFFPNYNISENYEYISNGTSKFRTCLHKLKSTQQGLQIGNNTNIFLVKSPNFIVL